MKRILITATFSVAGLVFSMLAARDADAIQLTLNFVQAQSQIGISGTFDDQPFVPQDTAPTEAGITDLNPLLDSMTTTFQGSITVDVNNVNAPSSIQILSSNADADVGGKWMPRPFPEQVDQNGNSDPYEFGLPPDGDSFPAEPTPAGPADDGDWGIRIRLPTFGVTLADAAARDIVFNITSPVEPVAGGQFSSLTQNFEFATGWLDYWVHPLGGGVQGRAELAGGDDDNASAVMSSYTVTPLPFNKREIKLVIPIDINGNPDDDPVFNYDGQLVATLVVPEPTSFVLAGIAMAFASALGARRRK